MWLDLGIWLVKEASCDWEGGLKEKLLYLREHQPLRHHLAGWVGMMAVRYLDHCQQAVRPVPGHDAAAAGKPAGTGFQGHAYSP